ncbi:hypothetical protein BaRGS_00001419 [Batillaria attramentaria]|uniref:Triple functional domain protein n=1 Tax=Batillaria attramentaria TaxID=370345 RepID=A0ABD0M699_9CAEN
MDSDNVQVVHNPGLVFDSAVKVSVVFVPNACLPMDGPPYITQEPAEASQNVEPAAGAAKAALEVTSEEPEPAQDIEIPPPMAIQDHSFKPSPEAPAAPVDEAVASLATLNLKGQNDAAASSLDLANELESIVKQRIEPNTESALKSESSAEDDGGGDGEGGEDGEKQDSVDSGEKDVEAEKAKYLKKRQFVIQELYDTELAYVEDLKSIVDGYMAYMKENPLPEDMEGKDKIVFGNIHQIYDWHAETMVKELEACLTAPEKVGSIFIRYERRLYMYVKYCENKPKSEYVVSEFLDTFFEEIRQKLGHRLTLPDLLIKPVQRIMRYQLLLRDILKYTEKAGADSTQLKKALRVMCIVPKAANDMMQVGRLQGFDGKITAQGKLLLQDTLLVAEVVAGMPQKAKERRLFLFEQIIIFSEMIERKKGDFSNASYVYKNSLKVNKMSMTNVVEGEPLKFVLIDRTPGSDMKYIIQAPSEEVKDTWIKEIRSILDMQGDFLRALQSPIAYQKEQKELTKELSAPEFGSLPRDSALRKTQSHPASGAKSQSSSPLAAEVRHKGRKDSNKHERCKSVPNPLSEVAGENDSDSNSNSNSSKPSCPNSPTDTSKDSKSGEGSSSESPKPKKTNFRGLRSLQRKSKNEVGGGSSGGRAAETTYANTHPVPEGGQGQDSNGGRTPSAESAGTRPPLSQAADSDQVPVSGSSLNS